MSAEARNACFSAWFAPAINMSKSKCAFFVAVSRFNASMPNLTAVPACYHTGCVDLLLVRGFNNCSDTKHFDRVASDID